MDLDGTESAERRRETDHHDRRSAEPTPPSEQCKEELLGLLARTRCDAVKQQKCNDCGKKFARLALHILGIYDWMSLAYKERIIETLLSL